MRFLIHPHLPALSIVIVACASITIPSAASDPDTYEIGTDPGIGFNLISWWNFGGSGDSVWENAVQGVYEAGFREVSISPVRYVTLGTGRIATTHQQGPELGHIAAGITRAKSLGMRVTVNPFIEPVNFSMWRGNYNPTPGSGEWTTFWDDYEQYLVDVAQIAEAGGADSMTVGTELKAITQNEGNNSKWNSVIEAVDAEFSGTLGYAANWDNYQNINLTKVLWEHPAIDFIGIDSYVQGLLSNSQADASGTYPNSPFIAQVESAWNLKLDSEILPFAAARKAATGMPVEFTEVGYLPYNRTSASPQNSSGPIDTDEQIMAFNGLLRALDGRADEFLATHIWQWGMPGSDGSLWNMDPSLPADQPNNVAVAQWLSNYVQSAIPGFSADFNIDGQVDHADLEEWLMAFNFSNAADTDGDDDSDGIDFLVWQQQFGSGSRASVSQLNVLVPEPAAIFLVLMGAAICFSWFSNFTAVSENAAGGCKSQK